MPSTTKRHTSRPTTPLRRIERGSLSILSQSRGPEESFPLDALDFAFAELSDSFSDLNSNMQQLAELGKGIASFNESFASFLYGLNVNAFCVDFAEAPVGESFRRAREKDAAWQSGHRQKTKSGSMDFSESPDVQLPSSEGGALGDTTYMTTDDSFVEKPPPRSSIGRGTKSTRSRGRGGRTRAVAAAR